MSDSPQAQGPIAPSAGETRDLVAFIRSRLAEDLGDPPYKKPVARLYEASWRALGRLAPATEALVHAELYPAWALPWDVLVEMASPWAEHPDYRASFALRADGTSAGGGAERARP